MTQATATADAYLRTKVLTASPEELRLMLLDGALKFARQGRDGLVERNFELCYTSFTQCRNILLELINSTRPEVDPELCRRVCALYTFMYRELLEANLEKNPARVDKVIELLEYERETWVLLMDSLAGERRNGDRAFAAAHAAAETAESRQQPLSVEG